ncbi:MAG: hypothetical protein JRG76_15265 [Deltaproteobacteria bacterium]|nr:hypothetical protein [Deltaproteobacteria bacterium]
MTDPCERASGTLPPSLGLLGQAAFFSRFLGPLEKLAEVGAFVVWRQREPRPYR